MCALCEWVASGQAVCGELKKETHYIKLIIRFLCEILLGVE